jgi:hypothetical protein
MAELLERAEDGSDRIGAQVVADAALHARDPSAVGAPTSTDDRNPYKGLRSFTEADTHDFFGRRHLVGSLIARLTDGSPDARFLAVVGPSGGGKSSVVRAGLLPAIRSGVLDGDVDTSVTDLTPGRHPMDELETALLRLAVRPAPRLRDRLEEGPRGLVESVNLLVPDGGDAVIFVDQFE